MEHCSKVSKDGHTYNGFALITADIRYGMSEQMNVSTYHHLFICLSVSLSVSVLMAVWPTSLIVMVVVARGCVLATMDCPITFSIHLGRRYSEARRRCPP